MKNDASHSRLRDARELGHEARVRAGDHAALKLWLRLLACTTQIEDEVRRRLRARFGVSLARFDYLAQLYRHGGLKMRDLSRYLMVTGGNITGLTDELERATASSSARAAKRIAGRGSCISRRKAGAPSRRWPSSTKSGSWSSSAGSSRRRCSGCTRTWESCGWGSCTTRNRPRNS